MEKKKLFLFSFKIFEEFATGEHILESWRLLLAMISSPLLPRENHCWGLEGFPPDPLLHVYENTYAFVHICINLFFITVVKYLRLDNFIK
jgi:hypothetical protein